MISLGLDPNSTGPITVTLTGHTDCGTCYAVSACGADVFSATDAAREYFEHSEWDFTFVADDYHVSRWPETAVLESSADYISILEEID